MLSDRSITINDTQSSHQHTKTNHCRTVGHVVHHVVFALPPISYGLRDAGNIAAGFVEEKNKSLGLLVVATVIGFGSAFYYTFPTFKENLHNANKLRKGGLPDNWPELSAKKARTALWISAPIILLNGALDGLSSSYFTQMMSSQMGMTLPSPFNVFAATFVIGFSTINSFGTEGVSTYEVVRNNIIGGQKQEFYSKLSKGFAYGAGIPLFIVKSLQDATQIYLACNFNFNIDPASPAKNLTAAASLLNVFSGVGFGLRYTLDTIDGFVGAIQGRNYTVTSTLATLGALGGGFALEVVIRPFNELTFHLVSGDYQFDNHDYMEDTAKILSYMQLVNGTITRAKALYPLAYFFADKAIKGTTYAATKISEWWFKPSSTPQETKPLVTQEETKSYGTTEKAPEASSSQSCLSRLSSLFGSNKKMPAVTTPAEPKLTEKTALTV